MRHALVWMAAIGCGFSPATQLSSLDAASEGLDGDAPADAQDLDRDCNPQWKDGSIRFHAPAKLSVSTPQLDRDPFLSPDELTLYFSTEDPTSHIADIDMATRSAIGGLWSPTSPFATVNTAFYESKMSISFDALTIVVCRSNATAGNSVYMAHRAQSSDAWPTLATSDLDAVDAYTSAYDPELLADGTRMYFAPKEVTQSLAIATRADTGSQFTVGAIPGYVASDLNADADPWADATEQLLVFSRNPVATGDVDIVYSVAAGGMFGAPQPVPGVNTVGTADADPWLSPDGCRLYFSSNRAGNYDLYEADAM